MRKTGAAIARTAASLAVAAAMVALPGCAGQGAADSPAANQQEQAQGASQDAASGASEDAAKGEASADSAEASFDSIPADAIISVDQLEEMLNSDTPPTVVDIRSRNDYDFAYIDGSKNIPAGRQLQMRVDELPRDGVVAVIALNNDRVAEARQTLLDAGFAEENVKVVDGGIDEWSAMGKHIASRSSRKC